MPVGIDDSLWSKRDSKSLQNQASDSDIDDIIDVDGTGLLFGEDML